MKVGDKGSYPSRQLKGIISMWDQKTRKEENTKSRSEEKVAGFKTASLFPARKREAVTEGGTGGTDHPTWRKTQGASIVKGWEEKRDSGCISNTFT